MQGEVRPIAISEFIEELKQSIPDMLFYKNVECLFEGLNEKETAKRKVSRKLANSNYGADSGYILMKYLQSYEYPQKGKCMAYLLDALSHELIDIDECLYYCKTLKDVSLPALIYLKENVHKMVIYNINDSNRYLIKELERNNLMYEAAKNGIAFEREAFVLDKFALSYGTEKYRYNEKMEGIPRNEDFPKVPVHLITSENVNHR